jgi:phosphoribosylformylglycinamidine cyclo-ligase
MSKESGPCKKDYRWAGVDIEAADEAVSLIKGKVESTLRPEVLGGVGGFASMFELDLERYKNPVIVSGTDGVGTKLEVARMMGRYDTIGVDLVAMCADDVVTCGAEPLFFQDYIATGRVVPERIAEIVGGIADGCAAAGCSLVGGEVAEHPGVMEPEDLDLAGFCVGVVEKDRVIDGSGVKPDDRIIGILSSGLHSNGYSLVRKLLIDSGQFDLEDQTKAFAYSLGDELLLPTYIYAGAVLEVARSCRLKAVAHITGGGMTGNVPRVIPDNVDAEIYLGTWPVKNIFTFIQRVGEIDLFDMLGTFNLGIGMVLVVAPGDAREVLRIVDSHRFRGYEIGEIVEGSGRIRYR